MVFKQMIRIEDNDSTASSSASMGITSVLPCADLRPRTQVWVDPHRGKASLVMISRKIPERARYFDPTNARGSLCPHSTPPSGYMINITRVRLAQTWQAFVRRWRPSRVVPYPTEEKTFWVQKFYGHPRSRQRCLPEKTSSRISRSS